VTQDKKPPPDDHPDKGKPEKPEKYFYFVDDDKYEWASESIPGAQIKRRIPNFDATSQLFLERPGNEPDQLIDDLTSVDLNREKGGPPRLYTVPAATFGSA